MKAGDTMPEDAPRKSKRPFPLMWLLLMAALAVTLAWGGATIAKYVVSREQAALTEAADFRFSSDYLRAGGAAYDVYDWNNGFEVKLLNSENGVRSAIGVELKQITVTGGTFTISGVDVGNGKTWIPPSATQATLTILPTAVTGQTVTVSVTTEPYAMTLSAVFTLKDAGPNCTYAFADQGLTCLLTIKTGSALPENITVAYGNDLEPDNLDPLMEGWTNANNTGTLTGLTPNATYELIFFDKSGTLLPSGSGVIDTDNPTITIPPTS